MKKPSNIRFSLLLSLAVSLPLALGQFKYQQPSNDTSACTLFLLPLGPSQVDTIIQINGTTVISGENYLA